MVKIMSESFIKFIIPERKNDFEFIGLNLNKNKNSFVFPCQYFHKDDVIRTNKEQLLKREARKIIFLLKKVRQDYYFGGNDGEIQQFHSMIWLIQDYIDKGYYVETEKIYKKTDSGKINWKQSIKNNNIWFNNGNIIYPNFVREKILINESCILSQIYKACLEYSIRQIGFIFSVEKTEPSVFDILKDKDFLVYFLTNELNKTYRDYKKILINHLLSIIARQDNKTEASGCSIYEKEIEYVFEYLINKIFGTEDVKRFFNTYSYHLPNKVSSSKLRPDTIMKDVKNKTFYIVDAKYYNFGYSNDAKNLPPSSSISKQIGYNNFLRENLPQEEKDFKVKSIFVLPYTSKVKNEYIKYVGYACRDGKDNLKDSEEVDDKVYVCLVDLKELINSYYNKTLSPQDLIKALPKN